MYFLTILGFVLTLAGAVTTWFTGTGLFGRGPFRPHWLAVTTLACGLAMLWSAGMKSRKLSEDQQARSSRTRRRLTRGNRPPSNDAP